MPFKVYTIDQMKTMINR